MKTYLPDSPEAIARILAMFMITDGNMDQRELETLESLHVYEIIGLSRKTFIKVLMDYCDDISDEAERDGTIHLIDKSRIDGLLADVTERNLRILTCVLALDICKSDEAISEPEMALLSYTMEHWQISLADLENEFIRA